MFSTQNVWPGRLTGIPQIMPRKLFCGLVLVALPVLTASTYPGRAFAAANAGSGNHSAIQPGQNNGQGNAKANAQKGAANNPTQKSLLPVPPSADQNAARRQLEVEFNRLYRGHVNHFTVGQFLQKLAAATRNPQHHPVHCYVALHMMIELSGTFNYFQQGQNAIEQMTAHYDVRAARMQAKLVHLWANSRFLTYPTVAEYLWAPKYWVGKAIPAGELHSARSIAADGLRLAVRFSQRQAAIGFRLLLTRIHQQKPMIKKFLAAEKLLRTNPDDPRANQTVGLFLIVTKDYVAAGAKNLALSADPAWRQIGKLGQIAFTAKTPCPPISQLKEASLWWSAADRERHNSFYAMEFRRMARWCFQCARPLINRGFIQLLSEGHYHIAVEMLNAAEVFVSHRKNRKIKGHADEAVWKFMLADIKKLRAKFSSAMVAVSAGNATPDLNESIGTYLCFGEGRWKDGLVYLSHARTTAIRAAARRDASLPVQPEAELAAGDAWWRLAKNASGLQKMNMEMRAAHWYRRALPQLAGRKKKRVQYRLLHEQLLLKSE